jgi:hypothetical protein
VLLVNLIIKKQIRDPSPCCISNILIASVIDKVVAYPLRPFEISAIENPKNKKAIMYKTSL